MNQSFANAASERHAQIYRAAAALFCERGYDATTMSDIAQTVGITKAALYYFVPGGKQDLLYDVMSFGLDRLEAQVVTPARAIADAETRLHTIIRNHVRIITEGATTNAGGGGGNPVTIVVDETGGLSKQQRRKIDERKRAYVELLRDTLRQLQTEQKLRALDATVAAFSLLGTVLWVARWYAPNGRLNAEQVAEEILQLALGGLLRASPNNAMNTVAPRGNGRGARAKPAQTFAPL
jgi:AcrR family transcriptional regulator